MRKRTRISRSKGSMWMSLARSLTACCSIEFTSRMIGASSVASSRSWGSCESSVARCVEIVLGLLGDLVGGGDAPVVGQVDGVEDDALAWPARPRSRRRRRAGADRRGGRCRAGRGHHDDRAVFGEARGAARACCLAKPIGTLAIRGSRRSSLGIDRCGPDGQACCGRAPASTSSAFRQPSSTRTSPRRPWLSAWQDAGLVELLGLESRCRERGSRRGRGSRSTAALGRIDEASRRCRRCRGSRAGSRRWSR